MNKEELLKAAREKAQSSYKDELTRTTVSFSALAT